MGRPLRALWLGTRAYRPVHELQQRLFEQRRAESIDDVVLFVEHEPVITLGKGTRPAHLLFERAALSSAGVDVVETARGGDVTFHGPGQLVAYPILALEPERRDVRRYVGLLAECMRRVLAGWDVSAGTLSRYVGVWVDRRSVARWPGEALAVEPVKLGAIGVRISRWVTMHGFALNLTTNLDQYRCIVPCGISEHGVASVEALTGRRPHVLDAARSAHAALVELLERDDGGFEAADRAAP